MIFNIIIICLVFVVFSGAASVENIILAALLGLVVYIASVALALSPIGEKIMRWQQGCHALEDPVVASRMQPIFQEVYKKAKELNPELPDNIELFISDETVPNAFALGRHTVCFTRGLLSLNDDDIKGILGHEFGHLSHKDTDIILVITIGNLIVSALFAIWRFFFNIVARITNLIVSIASNSWGSLIMGFITRVFIDFLLVAGMTLWTKLGVLICMASSRANEYLADKYSFRMGYGYNLCNALRKLNSSSGSKGIWAALNSSHPATSERINRLQTLIKEGVH